MVRVGALSFLCLIAGCAATQPEGASLEAPVRETGRQTPDEQLTRLERSVRHHGARLRQARYDVNDLEHALAEIDAAMAQARTVRSERARLLMRREEVEGEHQAATRALEERLHHHDEAAAALADYKSAADIAKTGMKQATPPVPAGYFPD